MDELGKVVSIKNFIDNADNYSFLKEFWKAVIQETIGITVEPYVNNFYANGKEILDGNPILSTIIKNNRGIRIIQLEADSDEPMLASWIDKIIFQGTEIEELIISLQLTIDTYTQAIHLIVLFANNALTSSDLLSINKEYDAKWNLVKASSGLYK